MTSAEVREQILDSLVLDLVGPVAGVDAYKYREQEIPRKWAVRFRWHMTGSQDATGPHEKTDRQVPTSFETQKRV